MVTTRNSPYNNETILPKPNSESLCNSPTPYESVNPFSTNHLDQELSAIMSKLNNLDVEVSELKHSKSHTKAMGGSSNTNKQIHEDNEDEDQENPERSKFPSKRPHSKVESPKFEGEDRHG